MAVTDRLKNAWNAFNNNKSYDQQSSNFGGGGFQNGVSYSTISPSRPRFRYQNERSIVSSIYTRIGIDVAAIPLYHALNDEAGRYKEDKDSQLNTCLTLEANIDQGPRAFRQDIIMTLFDRGVAAIVPVDTTVDPNTNDIIDIYTLRVGQVVTWYPKHVRVSVYNEESGHRQEITLEKRFVAIVENPLFAVMNEPNSTLQRLTRKLTLLDAVDEQSGSGKLDLIIQLPYVIKSEARRQQAEQRRTDIELQLKDSQYGIAYADGTEKITQLNRPVENNLMGQIEYLINMLYGQLGITAGIMDGTATEAAMLNYHNRTITPLVDAIAEAMQRSFIGPIGTKNLERIRYSTDPFKLTPVAHIAELADKFTRNEILTANEIRGIIGFKPSDDPKADVLKNANLRGPINPAVIPGQTTPATPDITPEEST